MKRLPTVRRILRWVAHLVFYWMVVRVCAQAAIITSGWHRKVPDWNPWFILGDAACALVMYWLLRLDEKHPMGGKDD